MQEWQQRVVDEKRELDDKLRKLIIFTGCDIFQKLDADQQDLLKQQAFFMEGYSTILGERIASFTKG